MSTEDPHFLTGAYALGALPGQEREAFERHLALCQACDQEVRELTATAARLGVAAATVPPPGMRDRVLAQVATVRQLPPGVPAPMAPGRRAGRWTRRLPRLVLAACLCAVAALGGVTAWQYQDARDARRQADQAAGQAARQAQDLAAVLAAPDARIVKGRTAGGAVATVVVSRTRDKAAFFASGMPALPRGRIYQLWFADGTAMRPAGLLRHDGGLVMDGALAGAGGMGLTIEPSGGSPQPTSRPLLLLRLPVG